MLKPVGGDGRVGGFASDGAEACEALGPRRADLRAHPGEAAAQEDEHAGPGAAAFAQPALAERPREHPSVEGQGHGEEVDRVVNTDPGERAHQRAEQVEAVVVAQLRVGERQRHRGIAPVQHLRRDGHVAGEPDLVVEVPAEGHGDQERRVGRRARPHPAGRPRGGGLRVDGGGTFPPETEQQARGGEPRRPDPHAPPHAARCERGDMHAEQPHRQRQARCDEPRRGDVARHAEPEGAPGEVHPGEQQGDQGDRRGHRVGDGGVHGAMCFPRGRVRQGPTRTGIRSSFLWREAEPLVAGPYRGGDRVLNLAAPKPTPSSSTRSAPL